MSFGSDEGSSTLETVLVMPLVVLVIALTVQAGVYFHAEQVAQLAADRAVAAARASEGTAQFGQAEAANVLHVVGDGTLTDTRVDVRRDGREVTVTIAAAVPHFVPFWPSSVTVSASGPTEMYSAAGHHG